MPVKTFEEAQAVFAKNLPGYTRRPNQIALAGQVEKHLADRKHLLAQASTGTGKSLALAIPAILSGRRTVFATPTKTLQDQYIKDFEFLLEHIETEDPFSYGVLKGRANYPCIAKAKDVTSPTPGQAVVLDQIEKLTTKEAIRGQLIVDRESFPELRKEEWAAFSMPTSECPGASSCPFSDKCFAERAKAKAAASTVVITNLAYLLQDFKLRQTTGGAVALLGDIDQVVIDEAHMLADAASSALEDTIGAGSFSVLSRDVASYLNEQDRDVESAMEIGEAGARLWSLIENLYRERSTDPKTGRQSTEPVRLNAGLLIEVLGDGFITAYNAIEKARAEILLTKAWDEKTEIQRARLLNRTASFMSRVWDYATDDENKTIRWIDREDKDGRVRLFLRSAPISVAPFLRATMFSQYPVILSSATLAAGTDFSPLMETLGLGRDEAGTFDAGTPFDYPAQSVLYVPGKDAPAPNENANAWRAYAQTVTRHLVMKSRGGAFLLFTSRSAMNEAWNALASGFEDEGLTVLKQDGDTPTSQLIRVFREDGNAVLFGLRTFFEGVDIQGRALRLVIIDKLPFAVPSDPKNAARAEACERKYRDRWAPLNRIAIPTMILVLTQAFGRLIRHREDLGVVAILDNRLRTKKYGARVLNALPKALQTEDLKEAALFCEKAAS